MTDILVISNNAPSATAPPVNGIYLHLKDDGRRPRPQQAYLTSHQPLSILLTYLLYLIATLESDLNMFQPIQQLY